MKFGMFYPVAVASESDLGKGLWGLDRARYDRAIQELREQAICADETGWTSMMFAEHHFEIEGYHVTPNPLMLNVYLAQHTKRSPPILISSVGCFKATSTRRQSMVGRFASASIPPAAVSSFAATWRSARRTKRRWRRRGRGRHSGLIGSASSAFSKRCG